MPRAVFFFFTFQEVFGKLNQKKQPSCEKHVFSSVWQHSVSQNTNMVADDTQHQFCPMELQQHQEMLSSKEEKSPSVVQQPSGLVVCSSRLFVPVFEGTLTLFITLNQNVFVLLSGGALWSVIPSHPTVKELS